MQRLENFLKHQQERVTHSTVGIQRKLAEKRLQKLPKLKRK